MQFSTLRVSLAAALLCALASTAHSQWTVTYLHLLIARERLFALIEEVIHHGVDVRLIDAQLRSGVSIAEEDNIDAVGGRPVVEECGVDGVGRRGQCRRRGAKQKKRNEVSH